MFRVRGKDGECHRVAACPSAVPWLRGRACPGRSEECAPRRVWWRLSHRAAMGRGVLIGNWQKHFGASLPGAAGKELGRTG